MIDEILQLLAVVIVTLGPVAVGSLLRSRRRPSFKKKLILFPVFVLGLVALGVVSSYLQEAVYTYLKQNVATSISGFIVVVLIAWFLYDFVLWRK